MALFASPVREFDGRKSLRSLADALEKLRELDGLSDQETVQIKTRPLELFDGRRTGCVSIVRPPRGDNSTFIVLMPSSGAFTALTPLGRLTYTIDLLNGAISDADGNVELANGQFGHGVILKPVPFYEFSETDAKIVRGALRFLQAENQCYRPVEPDLLPGIERLDYGLVERIRIEHLKRVQHYVLKSMPQLSPAAVSGALKRAGMVMPRSSL
jgi:hypothetical protein